MTDDGMGKGIVAEESSPRLHTPTEVFVRESEDKTLIVEGVGPIIRFGERAAPEAIKAWFRQPAEPEINLALERVNGRYECTVLRIVMPDNGVIDHDFLLKLPITKLVRRTVATALHVVLDLDSEHWLELARGLYEASELPVPDLRLGDAVAWPALGPDLAPQKWVKHGLVRLEAPTRTRAAAHQERLRVVADVYRQALDNNESTTDAVMRHENVSWQNAKNLVRDARKAGYLPPTTRGKRRGATTDLLSEDG
jgi:hypothetical protein